MGLELPPTNKESPSASTPEQREAALKKMDANVTTLKGALDKAKAADKDLDSALAGQKEETATLNTLATQASFESQIGGLKNDATIQKAADEMLGKNPTEATVNSINIPFQKYQAFLKETDGKADSPALQAILARAKQADAFRLKHRPEREDNGDLKTGASKEQVAQWLSSFRVLDEEMKKYDDYKTQLAAKKETPKTKVSAVATSAKPEIKSRDITIGTSAKPAAESVESTTNTTPETVKAEKEAVQKKTKDALADADGAIQKSLGVNSTSLMKKDPYIREKDNPMSDIASTATMSAMETKQAVVQPVAKAQPKAAVVQPVAASVAPAPSEEALAALEATIQPSMKINTNTIVSIDSQTPRQKNPMETFDPMDGYRAGTPKPTVNTVAAATPNVPTVAPSLKGAAPSKPAETASAASLPNVDAVPATITPSPNAPVAAVEKSAQENAQQPVATPEKAIDAAPFALRNGEIRVPGNDVYIAYYGPDNRRARDFVRLPANQETAYMPGLFDAVHTADGWIVRPAAGLKGTFMFGERDTNHWVPLDGSGSFDKPAERVYQQQYYNQGYARQPRFPRIRNFVRRMRGF